MHLNNDSEKYHGCQALDFFLLYKGYMIY